MTTSARIEGGDKKKRDAHTANKNKDFRESTEFVLRCLGEQEKISGALSKAEGDHARKNVKQLPNRRRPEVINIRGRQGGRGGRVKKCLRNAWRAREI